MSRRARLCPVCRMVAQPAMVPGRAWVLLSLLVLGALLSLR
jgi:hypothetical protein